MWKFLVIGLLVLVVACSPQVYNNSNEKNGGANSIGDGGLISREPCGPPCFFGITPGITIDTDVDTLIVNHSNIFANCQAFDFVATGGKRGFNCKNVNVGYSDHTVYVVGFTPEDHISIQQVMNQYGPPDLMYVSIVSLPDFPDRTGMTLYFDKIQAMLALVNQDGSIFIVQPETTVSSIVYLSKEEYQASKNFAGNLGWHGYGTYSGTR